MYFEDVDHKMSKAEVYRRLKEHLHDRKYRKGSSGKIREIIHNGDFKRAMNNAERLKKQYMKNGQTIYSDINEMNPYSNVHELVEQFMIAISK